MDYNLVKVTSCSLQELLNVEYSAISNTDIQGEITIPEYQRPYIWKEKQLNELLKDFIEYFGDKNNDELPDYYLGSIILHQNDGKLKIIDGQQRITTMLLLCKFLHPNLTCKVEYNASQSVQNINYNLSYLKSVFEGDIFEFSKNIDLLKERFDSSRINVTLIVTKTQDLAYTFFETQNTGGVRLSGTDILKAHHLRAIDNNSKVVKYQARKWEKTSSTDVEYVVGILTKIRFWDNRNWRQFPFYRNERGIKDSIIDEYTLKTIKSKEDTAYYFNAVKKEGNQVYNLQISPYRQTKQPLSDGNNTLDYINEYVELYKLLFKNNSFDYRIDDRFYEFRDKVLHGNNGTLFLKELLEITIIAYVSRFGFYKIFDATLWLYRMAFSMRVSMSRNVREDSIFKFAFESQFLDNILEIYTSDELFYFLEKFRYEFNTDNTELGQSKSKHMDTLNSYFFGMNGIEYYKSNPTHFDRDLIIAIYNKTKENE